jgi:hypothetical protein
MAHQRTQQITAANVLDALSNCAIRFANSDEEARYLAPRLRTSPEFLQSLARGTFAAFIRDATPQALAISVNRVEFGDHAILSLPERKALAERMRAEYGTPRQIAPPTSTMPEPGDNAPKDRTDIRETAAALDPNRSDRAAPADARNGNPEHLPPKPATSRGTTPSAGTEGATNWS